jgi:putative copper resistance protein D
MDWFGAGLDGTMIAVRAIHFAATAITAGTLFFRTLVAAPALDSDRMGCSDQTARTLLRAQTLVVSWIALAIALVSGAIWLLLQSASMSGLPFGEAMTSSVLLTVLDETQFGLVMEIRAALGIVLVVCLAWDRLPSANLFAVAVALGLSVTIAWTGHAGSTLGKLGNLHLAADALHLVAAAAWIGGLVPLALLLAAVQRRRTTGSMSLALIATKRFSMLGIASVATLVATGIVNAWILVGSFHALLASQYGRLLILKLTVFAAMLALAATNRFWLTPRLAISSSNAPRLQVIRQLARNSIIEIALGLLIFAIVGMLGTMHPAAHLM